MKIIEVLQIGKSLKYPAFWKKVQMGLALLAGFLPLIVTAIPALQTAVDHDIITKLDSGIAAVIVYLTVATTDKIGV